MKKLLLFISIFTNQYIFAFEKIENKPLDSVAMRICSLPIADEDNIPNFLKVTIYKLRDFDKKFLLKPKYIKKTGLKGRILNSPEEIYFIFVTDSVNNYEYFLVGLKMDYSCGYIMLNKVIGFGKENNKQLQKKLFRKLVYSDLLKSAYKNHILNSKNQEKFEKDYKSNLKNYFKFNKKKNNHMEYFKKCIKTFKVYENFNG